MKGVAERFKRVASLRWMSLLFTPLVGGDFLVKCIFTAGLILVGVCSQLLAIEHYK